MELDRVTPEAYTGPELDPAILSGKVEMDMFGGTSRKHPAASPSQPALGMTLGGFADEAPALAKAADLGGDCCADLEERVAALEATTVRKGNKKVSVTLSGWVVKRDLWWDDGHEANFCIGAEATTCEDSTSRFPVARRSVSAGPLVDTIAVEVPGNSARTVS